MDIKEIFTRIGPEDGEKLVAAAGSGDDAFVAEWIKCGLPVDEEDGTGGSALLASVAAGRAGCAAALFDAGADPRSGAGGNALDLAVASGRVDLVGLATGRTSDWNKQELARAMKIAAKGGHVDVLRYLIDGYTWVVEPDADPYESYTAWGIDRVVSEYAGKTGSFELLEALEKTSWFEHGAALAGAARYGQLEAMLWLGGRARSLALDQVALALVQAAARGRESCVEWLVEKGGALAGCPPCEKMLALGETGEKAWARCLALALGAAAQAGRIEAVKLLAAKLGHPERPPWIGLRKDLEAGLAHSSEAIAELVDWGGLAGDMTPAMRAASRGKSACLGVLVEYGGLAIRDGAGADALMWAAQGGDVECVRLLLGRCSGRRVDACGLDALMRAAKYGRAEAARALLPWADPLRVDNDGATALMWAARNGHDECVAALIPVSEVDAASQKGRTALIAAAWQGHEACVKLLMGVANPLLVDEAGVSAGAAAKAAAGRDKLAGGVWVDDLGSWESAMAECLEIGSGASGDDDKSTSAPKPRL